MNLSRIVERWATHLPDKTAVHYEGDAISYARLWRDVQGATGILQARGVGRGDRVAFLGYNHPGMIALLLALARLGAILVPLNWRLTAREHDRIVSDCAPKLLFADSDFRDHARQLGAPMAMFDGVWPDAPALPATPGTDTDDVLIVYTSGTTGHPKGAVLTQAALLWNAYNSIQAHDLSQSDHVLTVLPLFHVGGLNNQTLPALVAGATVSLHRRFDPGRWIEDVELRRPSVSLLVPATMAAVIGHARWKSCDLSSLRLLNSGSMVVPESLIRAFHARGIPVGQIYGSTETAPIATVLLREDAFVRIGSAGKPALHCEVKVVTDATGAEAAIDVVGEVWVRGPNVMRGYWNAPDATREAFFDGWFRTGDLGRRDADGFFWIAGRSKDVIISGGENIYPAELENVLADSDEIAEAAVVAVTDAKWGEAACACVVRTAESTLTEPAVLALFNDRLARYKHPKRVVFLDTLPKNAMGKVLKSELANQVASRLAPA